MGANIYSKIMLRSREHTQKIKIKTKTKQKKLLIYNCEKRRRLKDRQDTCNLNRK
jgi:hypothetical protein